MYWRLQLADYPIRRLSILPGTPGQLAASDSRQRVRFYQLDTGAYYNDLEIDLDLLDNDIPEERRQGLDALKAPNGAYLPFVEFNSSHLYVSEDGTLRLIHDLNAGITLEIDDQVLPLEIGRNNSVELVALDRELGTIAAFTSDHSLLIFQQQMPVASLPMEDVDPIYLFVKAGGDQILVIEAEQFRLLDMSGKVLRTQQIHYTPGRMALSPNGNWLLVADADHQLMRLYNRDLIPVRQQHAVDLLTSARQIQLFVDTPDATAPLVAVDITNDGSLAFSMSGVLCTAHIEHMTELPQPRLLL